MTTTTNTHNPQSDDAPVTENRAKFVRDLLDERAVPAEAAARLLARLATNTVTNGEARTYIEWLKGRARVQNADPDVPDALTVPEGRYAVATDGGAVNTLAFYKVDRPTQGKWAGRVFVKHIVGGDEERLPWRASRAVLAKIAAVGAEAASAAYGHEIGSCGVCGRQLTNDESRARGIGPICAEKNGW